MDYKGIELDGCGGDMDYELCIKGPMTIKTSKRCVVCLGVNEDWDAYVLPCPGCHAAHSRCFRKWIGIAKKMDCPLCGKIDWSVKKCVVCGQKGHWCCDVTKLRD